MKMKTLGVTLMAGVLIGICGCGKAETTPAEKLGQAIVKVLTQGATDVEINSLIADTEYQSKILRNLKDSHRELKDLFKDKGIPRVTAKIEKFSDLKLEGLGLDAKQAEEAKKHAAEKYGFDKDVVSCITLLVDFDGTMRPGLFVVCKEGLDGVWRVIGTID